MICAEKSRRKLRFRQRVRLELICCADATKVDDSLALIKMTLMTVPDQRHISNYFGEATGIANNVSSTTALRLISVNVRVQLLKVSMAE